jgi:pimeloyl-ACP methyl ester carboxylesterase
MVTIVAEDWSAIAIDGTRNFQQLALQGLYSLQGPEDFGAFSSLRLWYDAATRAIEALEDDGYDNGKPLFVTGHSYGAAVALLVAARVKLASRGTFIRYLTFACPKPGDARLIDVIRRCAGYSIRNTGDIVTVVPFSELQFWNFVPFYGAAALYGLARWEQPPEGYLQHDDGTLEARGEINPATAVVADILADAFRNVNLAPVQAHRLPEYQRRLALRCNEPIWPVNDDVLEDCEGCTPTPFGWLDLGGQVPQPFKGALILGKAIPFNNACNRAFPFTFGEEIILDGDFPLSRWWKIPVPNGTLIHCRITAQPGILIDATLSVGVDCNHLTQVHAFDLFDSSECFDRTTTVDTFWWIKVINYDAGSKFVVDFGSCIVGGSILLGGIIQDVELPVGSLMLGGQVPTIPIGSILLGGRMEEMIETILIEHRLNNNTNGGSAATNTWNLRPLNSLTVDTGGNCSLASNQFTLDAGKYVVRIWSVGNHIEFHKVRLLNVTDSTIDGLGASSYVFGAQDHSELFTYLDISSAKTYQVEHWSQTGQVTYGLGQPVNNGTDEVYCQVLIQKVG